MTTVAVVSLLYLWRAICFFANRLHRKGGDSMEILYVILAIVLLLIFVVLFVIINEIIKNIKK